MNEQPTSSNEPATEPVPAAPEPVIPAPESAGTASVSQPPVVPPVAAPVAPPPLAPPPVMPAPPVAPPPVYDWQQPAEAAGPAPGVRFAGYGARLIAYVVDGFLVGVAATIVFFVLAFLAAAFANGGSDAAAGLTGLLLFVAVLVIVVGYFPYFWARGGQTPGMRMVRIRVVRDRDGGPVTGGQAVVRLIGLWIAAAVFYLGYIWVFIDGRRRGWHDLIAGTVVIEA